MASDNLSLPNKGEKEAGDQSHGWGAAAVNVVNANVPPGGTPQNRAPPRVAASIAAGGGNAVTVRHCG